MSHTSTYYFHYRQGSAFCADEQGSRFADPDAAYLAAFTGAMDMWPELLRERHDPRRCSFEVCDSEGRLLFVLPFVEVLESCTDTAPRKPCTFSGIFKNAQRTEAGMAELRCELARTRRALDEWRKLIETADKLLSEAPHSL